MVILQSSHSLVKIIIGLLLALPFVEEATANADKCKPILVNVTHTLGGAIHSVKVSRGNQGTVEYARTNRSFFELYTHLGPEVISIYDLAGKQVLDAGMGDGQFVEDLRRFGVNAEGIDLVLTPEQKSKTYFYERDMARTGLESARYDLITSHWSALTYEGYNHAFFQTITKELRRLLKPGGKLIIYPVHSQYHPRMLGKDKFYLRDFNSNRHKPYIYPRGNIVYKLHKGDFRVLPPAHYSKENLLFLTKMGMNVEIYQDDSEYWEQELIIIATRK